MARTNKFNRTDYIPGPLARQIRKQCGFGCVVCGSAFYDYEHWNPPFEDLDTEPSADGITLACPNHHRVKGGLLSDKEYADCIAQPKALQDGFTQSAWSKGFAPDIVIGNVRCKGGTRVLSLNGETMIGFDAPEEDNAPPRLTARFFDAKGMEVFLIEGNRCIGNVEAWDLVSRKIEAGGWLWEVRHAARNIDLALELYPPDEIRITRMVWRNGFLQVEANDRGLQVSIADPNGPHSIFLIREGTVSALEKTHGFMDITVTVTTNLETSTANFDYHLSTNNMLIESSSEISYAKTVVL